MPGTPSNELSVKAGGHRAKILIILGVAAILAGGYYFAKGQGKKFKN